MDRGWVRGRDIKKIRGEVMEDLRLYDLVLDPTQLEERPPFKGKIVDVELKDGNYGDKLLVVYIRDKEGGRIRRLYLRISNNKYSKFGVFVERVNKLLGEAGFDTPVKISDLIGCVFVWKWRKIEAGNISFEMWVPEEFVDKEPITAEDKEELDRVKNEIILA